MKVFEIQELSRTGTFHGIPRETVGQQLYRWFSGGCEQAREVLLWICLWAKIIR